VGCLQSRDAARGAMPRIRFSSGAVAKKLTASVRFWAGDRPARKPGLARDTSAPPMVLS
jgi:hypothetical protein